MKARAYEGLADLYAMLDLLSEGSRANNGTHYVHRGDLQWWLFYTDIPPALWQSRIRLWMEAERLIGWTLLSPEEDAFDVFVIPALRGSSEEDEMLSAAVAEMSELDELGNVWVADDDEVRIRWFEKNGFKVADHHTVHFSRSLSGPLVGPQLPAGFTLRASRGDEADARLRAVTSHAAFQSGMPFDQYWLRTWRLMQSPIYVKEHEIFVEAPGGEIASYCIIWTDELTKVGHFEPVGTHPDFQRKGLGKCLLFEGLRRLKSEGMTVADLCTNHDNEAAIPLYESVGFQIDKRLLKYKKKRTT
jgi:ribosomal protein S18 acetylase RimI-like enzyme